MLVGGVDGRPSLVAGDFEVQLVDELSLAQQDVHVDMVLTVKTRATRRARWRCCPVPETRCEGGTGRPA